MMRRGSLLWSLLLCALVPAILVPATLAQPLPEGVQDLGKGRYQLGSIEMDSKAGYFTLPGVVVRHDGPLEFLAVSRGGYKAYESLLELDTTATEFNLACILIGLIDVGAIRPTSHFDPTPVRGDPVDIEVNWEAGGKQHSLRAADLFTLEGKPVTSHRWRYTGSHFGANNRYMAEEFGTLIGFVHDPDSIIHHREGLGLDDYGGVIVDSDAAPAVGQPVTLKVTRRRTQH